MAVRKVSHLVVMTADLLDVMAFADLVASLVVKSAELKAGCSVERTAAVRGAWRVVWWDWNWNAATAGNLVSMMADLRVGYWAERTAQKAANSVVSLAVLKAYQ
jgi:hypothetical protein